MKNTHTYLTPGQLGLRLRLSPSWLVDEAIAGRLPHLKTGETYRFNPDAVCDALDRRARQSLDKGITQPYRLLTARELADHVAYLIGQPVTPDEIHQLASDGDIKFFGYAERVRVWRPTDLMDVATIKARRADAGMWGKR